MMLTNEMDAHVVNALNEVSLDNLSVLFCNLYSEKLPATFYSGVFKMSGKMGIKDPQGIASRKVRCYLF